MSKQESKESKEVKDARPINITGNRPPPDRSPLSTGEGQRQEMAKAQQRAAAENAPKSQKSGKKTGVADDPRRYYQGSAYQNKVEEINREIATSNDPGEKAKLRKQLDDLENDVEEATEEQSTMGTTEPRIGMGIPDKDKSSKKD